eukprot:Rmarinus@m.22463
MGCCQSKSGNVHNPIPQHALPETSRSSFGSEESLHDTTNKNKANVLSEDLVNDDVETVFAHEKDQKGEPSVMCQSSKHAIRGKIIVGPATGANELVAKSSALAYDDSEDESGDSIVDDNIFDTSANPADTQDDGLFEQPSSGRKEHTIPTQHVVKPSNVLGPQLGGFGDFGTEDMFRTGSAQETVGDVAMDSPCYQGEGTMVLKFSSDESTGVNGLDPSSPVCTTLRNSGSDVIGFASISQPIPASAKDNFTAVSVGHPSIPNGHGSAVATAGVTKERRSMQECARDSFREILNGKPQKYSLTQSLAEGSVWYIDMDLASFRKLKEACGHPTLCGEDAGFDFVEGRFCLRGPATRAIAGCALVVDKLLMPIVSTVRHHNEILWNHVSIIEVCDRIRAAAQHVYGSAGGIRVLQSILRAFFATADVCARTIWRQRGSEIDAAQHAGLISAGLSDVVGLLSIAFFRQVTLSRSDDEFGAWIGIQHDLFGDVLSKPGSGGALLSSAGKSALLHTTALQQGRLDKFSFEVTRGNEFRGILEVLRVKGILGLAGRHGGFLCFPKFTIDTLRAGGASSRRSRDSTEGGEGHGPRKEFFEGAAKSFVAEYDPPGAPLDVDFSHEASSDKIVVWRRDRGSHSAGNWPHEVVPGCKLVLYGDYPGGVCERTVATVDSDRHSLRVTELLHVRVERGNGVRLRSKSKSPLVFNRDSGAYWFNPMSTASLDTKDQLWCFGWLLSHCIYNRATAGIPLPLVLFKKILWGPDFLPTEKDLIHYDPAYEQAIRNARAMSAQELQVVVEACMFDGVDDPASVGPDDYVRLLIKETLVDAVAWQMESVTQGFFAAVDPKDLEALCVTPEDLAVMVCGAECAAAVGACSDLQVSARGGMHVDKYFRVVVEGQPMESIVKEWPQEVSHVCPEEASCNDNAARVSAALWHVLENGLTGEQRRMFLRFATGSERLPLPGAHELLQIEFPHILLNDADTRTELGALPEAHTCDNLLEVPNYWDALVRTRCPVGWSSCSQQEKQSLAQELRKIVRDRLLLAIAECEGYGLDDLDDVRSRSARSFIRSRDRLRSRGHTPGGGDRSRPHSAACSLPDVPDIPTLGEDSIDIPTLEENSGSFGVVPFAMSGESTNLSPPTHSDVTPSVLDQKNDVTQYQEWDAIDSRRDPIENCGGASSRPVSGSTGGSTGFEVPAGLDSDDDESIF